MDRAVRALADLGAAEAVALLARGEISAEELLRNCLERVGAEEPRVLAFEHLEPEKALAEARRLDRISPRPPLGGLPVGVKDIVDTADMPTACGSPVHRGRRPARDAACVARLRAAGAVILGKTVTTEFAFFSPGKTRNPCDPSRTPGGSSSGSAAAVAARMLPAALGTQTAGSIVRPASYCGVVGWKPTFGVLPFDGVQPFAPSLDTLGLLVRDLASIPVLSQALGRPLEVPRDGPPPRVALCRTEAWPLAAPETRRLVEEAAAALARAGAAVEELDLGAEFAGLAEAQRAIMAAEAAATLGEVRRRHGELLSPVLAGFLREGAAVPPARLAAARAQAARCRALLPRAFARADLVLTPSAPGEAPPGIESTGDPAFNRIWTLLGTPCLSLPAGRGPAGLPVGIQLVGAPGGDGALLAAARWAARALGVPC